MPLQSFGKRRFGSCGVILFCSALVWTALRSPGQQAAPAEASGAAAPTALQQMQQVEDRWNDAVTKRDQYGMELVLAPQFIGISATGDVTTRNQQIASLFVKDAAPVSLEQKVVSARFVGEVAIVNGTYVMHWQEAKGIVDEKGIFTHVFERGRSGWLCLNSQRTVVTEEQEKKPGERDKPRSRGSNASLPLHIPLIYKGPASTQPPPKPGSDSLPQ